MIRYLSLIICLTIHLISYSQNNVKLSVDRIHQTNDFETERFGPVRWMKDGSSYTILEASNSYEKALEIVKYDAKTGKREIYIDATKFIPSGKTEPLIVENYLWSEDDSKILIFTNTKRVWRINTKGDYWVLDLKSNSLKQIGKSKPESSLMFAKFSPDNNRVAYVSKHNLYVEDLETEKITQLTFDGTDKIINGTFDWVYEEELGARDGFQWSPDGKNIAYWRVDATDIRSFFMINNTDSTYSFTIPVEYPKVGEDPSSVKVGVIAAEGGKTTWMDIPGDPKQNYLPRIKWGVESNYLYAQQLNRKQNTNKVWRCTISNGQVNKIYEDRDEAWLEVVNDWIWLNKGKEFTWLSEKDGWNHFYRVDLNGKETLVTDGDYDVVSIEKIDDKNGYVYFIASPDNPTQRYLFRKKLDGRGKLEKLSPENQPGTHSYDLATEADFAIHTYSTLNSPPIIDLVSIPSHKSLRVFEDNKKARTNYENLNISKGEFFKVTTADDVEMDGYIFRPPNFKENNKYATIFYVYGEPAGQTAKDVWSSRNLWHQMMAQQGYIVITLDNRGTPVPKGRAWRKSIYGKIGILNPYDQAMAAKEIVKWDFIDEDRIGVWGWSGGGSMTLNLLFKYPEIYSTGISIAPVGNQMFYDNIYQERYMGVPWENKENFIKGSPATYAKNLEGELLLIHGTGDDNVHYQNAETVINELIKNNKIFQMMPYPNRSHSINEGENTRRHLFTLMTSFFNDKLDSEPLPVISPK